MALSTSTTAPTGWAADAARSNFLMAQGIANQPYQQYGGPLQAGWNQGQAGAYNAILNGQGVGWGSQRAAEETARGVSTYQPQQVAGQGYQAAQVGAQNFLDANLQGYMNPYQSAVIDTTMQQLGRQNDILNNQTNARATAAGAFGGSRQAVMNGENNRAFLDTAGRTIAGLNAQNFGQAQQAIQTDQGRALQAGLANQTATNQASQFGAEQALRGQLANQQAGLTGASTRLGAANALSGIGMDQQTQLLKGAGAAFDLGQARTAFDQTSVDNAYNQWAARQNYPMTQLGILQQGLNGYSSGNSTTTPYHSNTAANVLAGGLGVGQLLANGGDIVSGASSLWNGAKSLWPV